MNKNFYIDNNEVSDSISSSIKYLMKKKEREKNNNMNNNINNSEKSKVEDKDIVNKKISEHNNFNFEKFKFIKNDDALKYNNFGLGNNNISIDINNDFPNGKKVNGKKSSFENNININKIIDVNTIKNLKGKKKSEKVSKKSMKENVIEKNLDLDKDKEEEDDINKEDLEKELLLNF